MFFRISTLKIIALVSLPVGQMLWSAELLCADSSKNVGLIRFQPGVSQEGITLIPEEGNASVRLISNNGTVLNTWNVDADRARLLPNCNLLVVHGTKWGAKTVKWRALRDKIREYNWEGEIVWEHQSPDPVHHDVRRLPDGSTYFLKRTLVPEEWQLRIQDPAKRLRRIRGDSILRVDRNGQVLSTWHAHEHLDLNNPGSGGWTRYTSQTSASFRMADWTHINTVDLIPENSMYERGDKRFTPGNLLIQARNWSTTMIIDKNSGDVVWEYNGDAERRISGGHEPVMIEKGFRGAGNILLLDNGKIAGERSRVLELNPVTKEIIWSFSADDFFTPSAGSAQRLPNGNTLISEDRKGHVFEVNHEGEKVWEYQSEFQTSRVRRYPLDFCPFNKISAPKSIQAKIKNLWNNAVQWVFLG